MIVADALMIVLQDDFFREPAENHRLQTWLRARRSFRLLYEQLCRENNLRFDSAAKVVDLDVLGDLLEKPISNHAERLHAMTLDHYNAFRENRQ
jgi:hypothetical protein